VVSGGVVGMDFTQSLDSKTVSIVWPFITIEMHKNAVSAIVKIFNLTSF